jgi:hypothetical protein
MPSCFSTTILAGLLSTAEVGHGRPENEAFPLPPEGEGQGEGINLRALRRQVVIEPCIVGFACLEAGLIIEANGGQHSDQAACDARRTMRLEGMGYRVLAGC